MELLTTEGLGDASYTFFVCLPEDFDFDLDLEQKLVFISRYIRHEMNIIIYNSKKV